MDKRDSSTPNEDCWHSSNGNFHKCNQDPSQFLGRGPGTRLEIGDLPLVTDDSVCMF